MSFAISIKRSKAPPPPPDESRPDYLRRLSGADVGAQICQAISGGGPKPWLTLVLGSGCTQSKFQADRLLAVATALGSMTSSTAPGDIDGLPVNEIAKGFAVELIRDRLRLGVCELTRPAPALRVDPWVFDLTLTAALLARLYHQIKAYSYEAPRRADHSDDAILKQESRWWGACRESLIDPCRALLKSLSESRDAIARALEDGPDQPWANAFASVLDRVCKGFREEDGVVRVSFANVQSFAEFAWLVFGVLSQSSVYPGWSDLLLDLSKSDGFGAGHAGRPSFQSMISAQRLIADRYKKITKESWLKLHSDSDRCPPQPIYAAAAELLMAEYEYRNKNQEVGKLPPMATAFVTSFDLELELALLKAGCPFTLALPVHVLDVTNGLAHMCWVARHVRPSEPNRDDGREPVALPGDPDWHVFDAEPDPTGPVVIRLAGSPLVDLPRLDAPALSLESLDAWKRMGRRSKSKGEKQEDKLLPFKSCLVDRCRGSLGLDARTLDERREIVNTLQLHHAVVISEYDAIVQNAIDLISLPEEQGRPREPNGLPEDFAGSTEGWSRFWLLLGVQMQDSGVRNRLATVIASLTRKVVPPGTPSGLASTASVSPAGSGGVAATNGQRYGLAVNMYLTALEQDLLFWNGFDLVHDEISAFVEDLDHYRRHLEREVAFPGAGACHV